MTNVKVPFSAGGSASKTATLLLAEAAKDGGDTSVVKAGAGYFTAPQEIVDAAGFGEKESADTGSTTTKKAASKRTTKKTTAKKTAAKKSTDKE
jgi:hypothetical protein